MKSLVACICAVLSLSACIAHDTFSNGRNVGHEMLAVELMQPLKEDAQYLGIADGDTFKLSDVDADILIIQFFSMYCPQCQVETEDVNDFFARIREKSEGCSVKIIGIGFANSDFEVALFKKKFKVAFPLFPDVYGDIARRFQVSSTPYYVVIERTQYKHFRVIHEHNGKMQDPENFLNTILCKME